MLVFELNLLPGESIPCDLCDSPAVKLIVGEIRTFVCQCCFLESGMCDEVEECGA